MNYPYMHINIWFIALASWAFCVLLFPEIGVGIHFGYKLLYFFVSAITWCCAALFLRKPMPLRSFKAKGVAYFYMSFPLILLLASLPLFTITPETRRGVELCLSLACLIILAAIASIACLPVFNRKID